MIDWLTGIFPCTHKPLPAGSVVSVDADGAIEWETVKRLTVRGSHEATMKVRSIGSNGEGKATHLYIDGNPSKFLQGHSVVGSDDMQGLMLTAYARILSLLNIPHDMASYKAVMSGQYKISRVDINYMYSLSTLENVRSWLYAAEFKAKTRHGRACGKGGTVYLGKNSRRWSLKFYSKYDEHVSGKKGHQIAEANSSPTSATGAASYINRSGDILVYYGTREDIEVLKTLVASLDTISDEVIVSGYVFEVQTAQSDGSGILLAAKILSEKFNISIGSANNLDNVISIKTGSVDAVFSLLKTDSRFTVVSAPRLRVKNNASASFSVGADVPVLGNVTVNNDTAVQSVDYRSSGVLFNVTPSIKSQTMDLKIQQQLSNFVTTETGVNNSPTLIKRDVTTEVSLADGDVILLGGLAEQKDSSAKSGWSFFGSKTKENSKTDIMVMLQVSKVDRSKTPPRSAARSGGLFQGNPD